MDFGIKQLEEVLLKATYRIEINGTTFEPGEVVIAFDKIQLANFNEIKRMYTSHGGYDDRDYVIWENTKEVRISFLQGVFSKEQFSFLMGNRLVTPEEGQSYILTHREFLESDEDGKIQLKFTPLSNLFVKDKNTGENLQYTLNENIVRITTPYKDVVVSYDYEYTSVEKILVVGRQLTEGFLELQAKFKTVDDITGTIKTGIIKIPRLKIMSSLSMRLGEKANPVIGQLNATAYPVGKRQQKEIMEMLFLADDTESDI